MYSDYHTDINYIRVIPRDLFNEAKLLKCMGHLTLKIHDGKGLGLQFKCPDKFIIGLMDDGYLTITNLSIKLKKTTLLFRTPYNSKDNYPLVCTHDYEDCTVFNEDGSYTPEFILFCETFTQGD